MTLKRYLVKAILLSAALVIVSYCKKRDETPEYDYFISKELAVTYTASTITGLLGTGAQQYPELNGILEHVKNDISVYKIVYKTDVLGEEIEASGLICIPSVAGDYPVISFQNGTNTVNAYAPSEFVINPSYQLVEFIASMGFVVVIPDYPGFGKSKQIPHPYLIKEPTVKSVVDMLYALEEICNYDGFEGVKTLNEYYLVGYSQGGWATLALHKALEQEYSSDFNLNGSVCGAGPYDLYALLQGIAGTTEYPMPYYLGYIVSAYSYYNQFTNPVAEILDEPYASRLSTLYNGTLSGGQINDQLTTSMTQLFRQDFISGFTTSPSYSSVRNALTNNSVTPWKTEKPVLFVHGESDTHVSVSSTHKMFEDMLQSGTSPALMTKIIIPELDHGDAIVPGMMEGLDFIFNLISE